MELKEILTMLGFGTFFGGICSFFLQRFIKSRDKVRDLRAEEERIKAKNEQDAIRKKTEALEKQNVATQLGVQALLRDRLLQAFKFYINQGYADYDDRQNVLNMYTQYESLGPNKVMENLYHRFEELPLEL